MNDIQLACRAQTRHHLDDHATRVDPRYRWNDLVLPPAETSQLRELAAHADHAVTVMESWGFADKLSLGRGLTALFHGPSGTGKTMAAEVLAAELGLELYVIDLSRVISKYIGECEKALAAVFDEAETANALLLFDECDALFGKRSEVRDSHDRYANIEVAYLLQRLEAYRGIAVLTTNLRRNMDEAFVRRIRFRVRFHAPTTELRLRIWRGAFPAQVPLLANVDLRFLADRFELTGATIKSAALRAAHLAAAEGGVTGSVGMRHAVRAVVSELRQLERPVTPGSFGPYAGLIEGGDVNEEEAA